MKLIPIQIAVASALALSSAASFAQTAAPAPVASPWAFNISLTTNYKFRGQDQDLSRTRAIKPALQGGVDYAFDNGFYLGNWNSMIDFANPGPGTTNRAHLEMDFYGGYKFSSGDWGFDIGALQYYYPSVTPANTTEIYFGASYGAFSAKYSSTVSKGYFGIGPSASTNDGRGTGYLNFAFAKEIASNTTFKASIGQTMFTSNAKTTYPGLASFTDYSLGLSYDLGNGLSLGGYVQGASEKNNAFFNYTVNGTTKSANKDVLLFTLTKTL